VTVEVPSFSTTSSQSVPRIAAVPPGIVTLRRDGAFAEASGALGFACDHARPCGSSSWVGGGGAAALTERMLRMESCESRTWVRSRSRRPIWLISPVRTKLPATSFCLTAAGRHAASAVSRASPLPISITISASLARASGAAASASRANATAPLRTSTHPL
jgi:hypothetical protein